MDYFLDTNACIALIKGEPAGVRARLKDVVGGGAQIDMGVVSGGIRALVWCIEKPELRAQRDAAERFFWRRVAGG
jgi:hypothetical protein